MPKFIGNEAPEGAIRLPDNARASGELVHLTYSQMVRLPPEAVRYSLDTTDKGSRGSRAKRWYRWFAVRDAVLSAPEATEAMLRRARGEYPVGESRP